MFHGNSYQVPFKFMKNKAQPQLENDFFKTSLLHWISKGKTIKIIQN